MAFKVKPPVKKIEEDDEPTTARIVAVNTTVPTRTAAEPEQEEVTEVAAPVAKTVVTSAPTAWVKFSCFVDMDPAPRVGKHFSFVDDLGVTQLKKQECYTIPRHVAEHLIDKKVGIIVG